MNHSRCDGAASQRRWQPLQQQHHRTMAVHVQRLSRELHRRASCQRRSEIAALQRSANRVSTQHVVSTASAPATPARTMMYTAVCSGIWPAAWCCIFDVHTTTFASCACPECASPVALPRALSMPALRARAVRRSARLPLTATSHPCMLPGAAAVALMASPLQTSAALSPQCRTCTILRSPLSRARAIWQLAPSACGGRRLRYSCDDRRQRVWRNLICQRSCQRSVQRNGAQKKHPRCNTTRLSVGTSSCVIPALWSCVNQI